MVDFQKVTDLPNVGLVIQRRQLRKEELFKRNTQEEKEKEKLDETLFEIFKSFTILSGTIFASTIALSTNKIINHLFFSGEIILLLSIICGTLLLWGHHKGNEWWHFFFSRTNMESDLLMNDDLISEFEKNALRDLINSFRKLTDRRLVINHFLRIFKVDWLQTWFFEFFFCGLVCILLSLII